MAITRNEEMSIFVNEENKLNAEVSLYEIKAQNLEIENDYDFQVVSEFTRGIKSMEKKVKNYWEPMRVSTKKAYDDVISHKKEMLEPLENAERIIKEKMADYTLELRRKQREKEEELKKLAQVEVDKKLDEAMELQANGDVSGAEYAMAEAEVMDGIATTSISTNVKPKADGISMTKTWKITSIDLSEVPDEINGALIRPVDMSAVMTLIKASKGSIEIPGIKFEESVTVNVRSN